MRGAAKHRMTKERSGGVHRIVHARWTETVNMLLVHCPVADKPFETRADRWRMTCLHCGAKGNQNILRQRMLDQRCDGYPNCGRCYPPCGECVVDSPQDVRRLDDGTA